MKLPLVVDAESACDAMARVRAGHQAPQLLQHFRDPPSEPTTCCGRGCNGCVWEGYFAAVTWWCEDAFALADVSPSGPTAS